MYSTCRAPFISYSTTAASLHLEVPCSLSLADLFPSLCWQTSELLSSICPSCPPILSLIHFKLVQMLLMLKLLRVTTLNQLLLNLKKEDYQLFVHYHLRLSHYFRMYCRGFLPSCQCTGQIGDSIAIMKYLFAPYSTVNQSCLCCQSMYWKFERSQEVVDSCCQSC